MITLPPEPPAIVETASQDAASVLVNTILALQTPNGAFADEPGGTVVNADSNMLYLLTGLADYAEARKDPRAWQAVESGLVWLANRLWTTGDPLANVFPDALPLDGPATPMGSPPVAAVGATAARFVALVGRLPVQSTFLRRSAANAWAGLKRLNLDRRGFIWNSWFCDENGQWIRSEVRYAADQADFLAGFQGAWALGLELPKTNPFLTFPKGCLAMNKEGNVLELPVSSQQGAWAVLAFDGPFEWRSDALEYLKKPNRSIPYIMNYAARAALGDADASDRLRKHLAAQPLPKNQDMGDSPVYMPVAGFVLRALVRIDGSLNRTRSGSGGSSSVP